MPQRIKIISLSLPYRLGHINCYLVRNNNSYILIDTGSSNCQSDLVKVLSQEGCKSGNLQLIVLTHGDFDHSGNAAYFQKKFGIKIAIHYDDSCIVENGNMFGNRNKPNILIRKIISIFFRFGKSKRFKPDIHLSDGYDLSEYGFNAKVLHIPGHSKGSIGILTADNDLFCGDLFENTKKPKINSIMDDLTVVKSSTDKLMDLRINMVYPGHGKPFSWEQLRLNK